MDQRGRGGDLLYCIASMYAHAQFVCSVYLHLINVHCGSRSPDAAAENQLIRSHIWDIGAVQLCFGGGGGVGGGSEAETEHRENTVPGKASGRPGECGLKK